MFVFLGKCFTKLNYNIDENLVKGAVSCKTGSIELVLQDLRQHVGFMFSYFIHIMALLFLSSGLMFPMKV